ncbi:hypothetical protein GGI11_002359 [Coemansia sp. RSA 2049]|nr:hypothetical protein H4217_005263 [Coemansia sp. RSA 1939]KAJ2520185.1 hypothetical protein GGI11_002359 [Coemansia sp. RSA 2049]KAJ2608410.1 hypothetical protein EV177_004995 [Coemansia sp. RSA 1804]KAJ2693082.1 hypothetical protein GGH99_001343 [Coemansia sp. RSA 1285]
MVSTTTTTTSTYLSATKLVLLVIIDQYSRHYDWDADTQCELAQFLVSRLCEPSWNESWQELGDSLDRIPVVGDAVEGDQTLRQLLCRRMEDGIRTLDGLHEFFDELRALVTSATTPPMAGHSGEVMLLDSESILGLFVRRCCLAFDQLEFHQTGAVFNEYLRAVNVIRGGDTDENGCHSTVVRSRIELQEHLEHQVSLLEAEVGGPVPAEMEDEIRRAMGALPDHSRTYYLDYLNQVRTGECYRAEASLRRFFDSNAIKDNRTMYQYALLYLAAMRARLGMVAPALLALTEATHVARDCQDHVCLLYIMFWRVRLLIQASSASDNLDGNTVSLEAHIRALIDKAVAMQNYGIWAAGLVLLADYYLQTQPASPSSSSRVFSTIVQAHAVLTEYDVHGMRGPWHLVASRAWLHYSDADYGGGNAENKAAAWLALLHVQIAAETIDGDDDDDSQKTKYRLTEHEHVQAICQLARVRYALCGGSITGAQQQQQYQSLDVVNVFSSPLLNPARADELRDTFEWLRLESTLDDQRMPSSQLDHPSASPPVCSSSSYAAQQLADARDLIAAGYTADAKRILLSVILCDDESNRQSSTLPLHTSCNNTPSSAQLGRSAVVSDANNGDVYGGSRGSGPDFKHSPVASKLARQMLASIDLLV